MSSERKEMVGRHVRCRHEAGHVWRCWKHGVTVHEVRLGSVCHEKFPDWWSTLLNLTAGIAVVAKHWGWSYEEALVMAGGVGKDGGDILEACVAVRDGIRTTPPPFYEDEVRMITATIRKAFDQNLMDLATDWDEVTKIGDALIAGLAHDGMRLTGRNLAMNSGKIPVDFDSMPTSEGWPTPA